MKRVIISSIIASVFVLVAPRVTQAQGTMTYLSNLGQASAGSLAAGSDAWLAAMFFTGTNVGGYQLNSIQLAMTDAMGNPSGFSVMLCLPAGGTVPPPSPGGPSLGTLNGSLDPLTAGIYTYTPAADLTLAPNHAYCIVVTAGTAVASGAYEWSYSDINSYNPSGGWSAGGGWTSHSGRAWTESGGTYFQFAISAPDVPEPSTLGLLALGGFLLVRHRRKACLYR
jgi:hypothetical protein